MRAAIAAAAGIALCGVPAVSSFARVPTLRHAPTSKKLGPSFMFFADAAAVENSEPGPSSISIAPLDGSEASIQQAAEFLVDSFWLGSPQQLVVSASSDVSEAARSSLVSTQAQDLNGKYGERMGKRKLDALILAATDEGGDGAFAGLVTLEVRLLDRRSDILSADASEFKLTQAVAALGPKQRREYKDASVIDIANALLPPDISAVCSLSNLCVSPSARRKGIAENLCNEAERFAKKDLGFDEIYLRVESENEAAKRLYEEKLGYEQTMDVEAATALRVDGNKGEFVEVTSDIVVLKKKI
ncbi:hypothetical protein ACHAXT_003115 [Thalassiosira profunda]